MLQLAQLLYCTRTAAEDLVQLSPTVNVESTLHLQGPDAAAASAV